MNFLFKRIFLPAILIFPAFSSYCIKTNFHIPFSGEAAVTEYYADLQDLNKVYIFQHSEEYYERFSKLYKDWLSRLVTVSFKELNKEDQVDFILLKRNILSDQYHLEKDHGRLKQVQYALAFAPEIIHLQQQRRRGNSIDAAEAAKTLNNIINQIKDCKSAIIKKPLDNDELKHFVIETVKELQDGLQNFYSFYNNYDPEFTWWMKTTYPETDSALASYAKWIEKQHVANPPKASDSSGIVGNPIGKEELLRLLKYEFVPYDPDQLIQIATKQYEWCLAEIKKASREMGYGDDWKKALEKVKEDHLPPGKQPQRINELEEFALHFIDSLNLVTIPPLARESWRMVMLSPEEMRFASYFLGGPLIMVAYANEEQDFDTKMMIMRSGNYSFARAEVFHELIPGHNLQYFMTRRYRSYRSHFSTPFNVEGWAFYWEMMLWDKGYNRTPEEKMGALFWRMTRCARIVFSLNYHLKNWTPQQCIDYLVDNVGLERFSAESEVRRSFTGGYGPLYQLAYMMGALQMYSLHHEAVDGGKMSDREFNDAFLHNGTIPVEMFRAIVLNKPLHPDYTSQWKFAGDIK